MENYIAVEESKVMGLGLDRTATWSKIGTNVRTATTVEEVLKQAGLDYEVTPSDIVIPTTGEVIPDKVANIDSNGRYLGVVGKDYRICQNTDAFDFVNCINDELTFIKAGETHTGMVYIIGELPSIEVFGDEITPNVILQNGHNGRYSLKTTIVPLRIACQNQFNIAFKEIPSTISIHHSRSIMSKMEEAKFVLQSVSNYMTKFKEEAERLYDKKLTRTQVNNIIEGYFKQSIKDMDDLTERKRNTIERNIGFMKLAYDADDNQNLKGNMFGLINAFADYMTHCSVKQTYADSKFLSTSFDNNAMMNFMDYSSSMVA